MSRNLRTWGEDGAASTTLTSGVAFSLVLIILGFVLPEDIPSTGIAIGAAAGMRAWYIASQGKRYEMHLNNGALQGSWWHTVGVGILAMALTLGIVFGVDLLFLPSESQ